jgi:hypothetical protein
MPMAAESQKVLLSPSGHYKNGSRSVFRILLLRRVPADYFVRALRHFMQIFIRLGVPLTTVFMVRRLRRNIRLFTLCAWEILLPVTGALPHTSHFFDMISPLVFS